MTIFRLNFLLKVGQMKVCQNPSFISTMVFQLFNFFCIFLYFIKFSNKELKKVEKWTGISSGRARIRSVLCYLLTFS